MNSRAIFTFSSSCVRSSQPPMTVLTGATTEHLLPAGLGLPANIDQERRQLHQQLAARSSRGTWRVVPGSDHLIANSQPHAVAEAVLAMIAAVKGGAH